MAGRLGNAAGDLTRRRNGSRSVTAAKSRSKCGYHSVIVVGAVSPYPSGELVIARFVRPSVFGFCDGTGALAT